MLRQRRGFMIGMAALGALPVVACVEATGQRSGLMPFDEPPTGFVFDRAGAWVKNGTVWVWVMASP